MHRSFPPTRGPGPSFGPFGLVAARVLEMRVKVRNSFVDSVGGNWVYIHKIRVA